MNSRGVFWRPTSRTLENTKVFKEKRGHLFKQKENTCKGSKCIDVCVSALGQVFPELFWSAFSDRVLDFQRSTQFCHCFRSVVPLHSGKTVVSRVYSSRRHLKICEKSTTIFFNQEFVLCAPNKWTLNRLNREFIGARDNSIVPNVWFNWLVSRRWFSREFDCQSISIKNSLFTDSLWYKN